MTAGLTAAGLRDAYGAFPTGVVAVCAAVNGTPVGLAMSSFTTVSLAPPLVSVCVQHTSTTWPVLAGRPRVGLSVLGAGQGSLCRRLASKTEDRFAGVGLTVTDDDAVLLDGAAAWFECSPHDVMRAGDHDVVLLRVEKLQRHHGVSPLIFYSGETRDL
ncbi:flavin reductase (DIM6/NTAB) family NADH-FMN oxidoreductase RutF [Amycolatopsis bartoniae]|uniref:Putative oxidoreductase n=1 Tax=Amycolatopsis bartoniae TaxID=941986 RepID=A0A8H9IPS6_9PSEU|nr:flavin reductase family protein [Amycolatopsis bartoniae]MBB2940246.1 flavin reductase (DIM6/NTAB) family NADH-FMN oxidoreductase RutF [Amycolatopsis bartoniae]TVT10202.1 flavin reductase family protein [Amycolatopsis bartoniae]GHF34897.1 putative oxidoreductase [Amycolatopsis bartoniae]